MCWVRGVLDDAASLTQTPLPLDVLNGSEWSSNNALGGFHHPLYCFPVRDRAVPVDCHTAG